MEEKKKVFKLSRKSKSRLKGIDSRLIKLIERAIKLSLHDFGIPEYGGLRTPQEQNNLFYRRPSVTQLDGFKRKSYHQSGKAFDIFLYDEHGACWDYENCGHKYKEIADLFKQTFNEMVIEEIFGLDEVFEWGGDWTKFKDYPHFQLK